MSLSWSCRCRISPSLWLTSPWLRLSATVGLVHPFDPVDVAQDVGKNAGQGALLVRVAGDADLDETLRVPDLNQCPHGTAGVAVAQIAVQVAGTKLVAGEGIAMDVIGADFGILAVDAQGHQVIAVGLIVGLAPASASEGVKGVYVVPPSGVQYDANGPDVLCYI